MDNEVPELDSGSWMTLGIEEKCCLLGLIISVLHHNNALARVDVFLAMNSRPVNCGRGTLRRCGKVERSSALALGSWDGLVCYRQELLQTVVNLGVSDLHITVGQPPVVRLDGHMRRLETPNLEADDTTQLMKSITPERCQTELQEVGGTDFGFAFGEQARFRVAVFKQRGNIGMVLRRIPYKFLTFEELGLPPAIRECIERPRGLFLVTGPTGSGKSTSLASMINFLNESQDHHIITIEDPIEYYHKHKRSTVNQREIGIDVPSFPEAIRRALRWIPTSFWSAKCATSTRSRCHHRGRNGSHCFRYPSHQ